MFWEKKKSERKGPQRNTKNLNARNRGIEIWWRPKPLNVTPKETKQHTCGVEPQGLPNLTKKKNDEKLEKNMK
jgi:hypothetical protein